LESVFSRGWFEMGVTIHYCLGAWDGNAVERALDLAELMARRWGMKVERRASKWVSRAWSALGRWRNACRRV
jgi:hypothetical protein